MEFKDKLRALRAERQISQRTLAEAIFVSRSAVAKWENGLGLPSEESHLALLRYFGVDRDALPLCDAERSNVTRRRWLHTALTASVYLVTIALMVLPIWLYRAHQNGFSFTEEAAIGAAEFDVVWRTEHYTICYDLAETEDGSRAMATSVRFVRRVPLGYRVIDPASLSQDVYYGDMEIGRVYTVEDEGVFYHLYRSHIYLPTPDGLPPLGIGEVTVNGKIAEKKAPALFATVDRLEAFSFEGREYRICWKGAS